MYLLNMYKQIKKDKKRLKKIKNNIDTQFTSCYNERVVRERENKTGQKQNKTNKTEGKQMYKMCDYCGEIYEVSECFNCCEENHFTELKEKASWEVVRERQETNLTGGKEI